MVLAIWLGFFFYLSNFKGSLELRCYFHKSCDVGSKSTNEPLVKIHPIWEPCLRYYLGLPSTTSLISMRRHYLPNIMNQYTHSNRHTHADIPTTIIKRKRRRRNMKNMLVMCYPYQTRLTLRAFKIKTYLLCLTLNIPSSSSFFRELGPRILPLEYQNPQVLKFLL